MYLYIIYIHQHRNLMYLQLAILPYCIYQFKPYAYFGLKVDGHSS